MTGKFVRPQVGPVAKYRGYNITVRYLGPDHLAYVDDGLTPETELGGFYMEPMHALRAGERHVDHLISEFERQFKNA